jgi:HAD superfamily hydrolase (TIGR01484 family)
MPSNPHDLRLIALDLDGTLLNPEGAVSARNRQALLMAQDLGIEIVIATGRRHCYAMKVLRDLGLNPASALVSSNGTVIRTLDAQLLTRTLLPAETARWLCSHLTEFRSTLVMTFDRVGHDGEDMCGALVVEDLAELQASIGAWMRANAPYIAQVTPLENALDTAAPIQMMLCGPVARMQRAEAHLLAQEGVTAPGVTPLDKLQKGRVALHRTTYPNKDLSIVDILPAGCSKASALAELVKLRGCGAENVLAIGDNWNDVAMLEFAGHARLMANAPPDLLGHRRWPVTLDHSQDGVAHAIEELLAENACAFR